MDRARQNQESYDRIASHFLDRNRDRSVLLPWMRSFAALVPVGGLVLDLGAGPCHDSAELRGLGLRVVSLDRSRQMLTVARSQYPGPRIQADMRHLPFRRGSLAGVWANASLLHLDRQDVAPVLTGIAEVLVRGGALFVSVKDGDGERWETARYGAESPRWFTYWSREDLDAILCAAGFELVEAVTRTGSKDVWHVRIARCTRRAA